MTLLGLLTLAEAAEGLGVSPHTVRRWVRHGLLSPFATQGGVRLYLARDIVEAQRTASRKVAVDTAPTRRVR